MTFHTWQKNIDPLTFTINGKQIENVKFFKYRGIMFDEHLTWKNHITKITNKTIQSYWNTQSIKKYLPSKYLLSIYSALFFLSHMVYYYGVIRLNKYQNYRKNQLD